MFLSRAIVHEQNGLEVLVADNGLGFDAEAAGARSQGLRGMRERAASLGGRLAVESAPGRTVVRLWLPLRVGVPSAR